MNSSIQNLHLLVIDDDDLVRKSLPEVVSDNWLTTCAPNLDAFGDGFKFDAALVDLHLTDSEDADGLKVIQKLSRTYPHLEIIAMSGDLNRELMEQSLKCGASRFLAKPLNGEEINLVLKKIESWVLLQKATQRSVVGNPNWVGDSEASLKIKKAVAQLSGEKGPILIEGETGTGKEVIAHLLHQQSRRGPFVPINVAAIPDNLFESELFGHVKGAFTGADQNKMGLAEAAQDGTLFIDEIEALALPMQVKLLRFLESGEVKRVGAKEVVKSNALVIVASNKSLEDMVKRGDFREDLLWRIKSSCIELPPLRLRKQDIKKLCHHFFKMDRIREKYLNEEALEVLNDYDWPGNVRELKRVCEQLLINSPLPMVRPEDVRKIIAPKRKVITAVSADNINLSDGLSILVGQYEAQVIAKSLDQYKDIDEVARKLKISRSSLYKKIKDFDIDWRH